MGAVAFLLIVSLVVQSISAQHLVPLGSDLTATPQIPGHKADWVTSINSALCNNVLYAFNISFVDYATAAKSCQNSGGSLAAFDKDPSAWDCVKSNVLRARFHSGWIGLTRAGSGNQDFVWSDGKAATAVDVGLVGKDVTGFQGQADCVHFWTVDTPSTAPGTPVSRAMTWNVHQCSKSFQYLCQFDDLNSGGGGANTGAGGTTPKLPDPSPVPSTSGPTAKLNSCCNVNPKNWKASDAVVTYHTVPQEQLDYILAAGADATNTKDSPYDRCALLQQNLTSKYPRKSNENGWYCVTGCGSMQQHGSYGWFTGDATFWFGDIKIEILRPQPGS